jgi:YbgC/YbaW family acyl-CoA thioester hydrolase
MNEKLNIEQELAKYHFRTSGKVEFYQIDALQVLYNIQYLYIFENSRLAYMRKLGFVEKIDDLRTKFSVLTVHHSIDYFNPGFYGDEYTVYCRISQIKTSSFTFENIMI